MGIFIAVFAAVLLAGWLLLTESGRAFFAVIWRWALGTSLILMTIAIVGGLVFAIAG